MTAIITGNGLGLINSSLNVLGQQNGVAALGRSGEGVYVNAATGNLVVQRADEILMGRGPDVGVLRTYNSLGLVDGDNNDNWRIGFYRQIKALTGTVNTAGSTVTRVDADGAELVYTYDSVSGKYINKDGSGSYDTLSYNGTSSQWTWTDGDSRATETYDWISGSGKLLTTIDADNNSLGYIYTGALLTRVISMGGESTYLDYTGTNLTQIRTVRSDSTTITRVRYGYDASNRLATVTVDLSPADNSVVDGKTYTATYTYDGTSDRIASITQTDGSKVSFVYDAAFRVSQITQTDTTSGATRITTLTYDTVNRKTTVTDPLGYVTVYTYDTANRLTNLLGPTTASGSQSISTSYTANGDVATQTDARGNVTSYTYDANGNRTLTRDAAGNTVTRTYGAKNELLTETLYLTPDPDGAGVALPSAPVTTRYAYDAENHLRFVVSADGRVSEYRYNAYGQQTSQIVYAGNLYDISALTATQTIAEATLVTWVGTADKTQSVRSDTTYDFRGQVNKVTTYAEVDTTGAGVVTSASSTQYVYDQAGNLLQTIAPKGVASTTISTDFITSFTYDGLGRVLSATDTLGHVTLNSYNDAGAKTTVTLVNGLASTSTYNRFGELISVLQADGATALGTTTYTYDKNGRLRMTQDPTGVKNYFLYDEAGRKVGDLQSNGSLIEYAYNVNDQLIKTARYQPLVSAANVAALDADISAGTNSVSLATLRPLSTGMSGGNTWNLYDTANRLAKTVDGYGLVTQMFYDGANRITDVIQYATAVSTLAGNLNASTLYTDAAVSPAANGNDRRTRNFYDNAGNTLATLDAAGYLTENQYDSAGRLIHTTGYATLTNSSYWATGTLAQLRPVASGNDIHNWTLYNDRNQEIASVDGEGYLTETTYDTNGNKTFVTSYANKALIAPQSITSATLIGALRPSSNAQDRVAYWTYTDANQIASVTDAQGTITQFAYDSTGNLTRTDKAFASPGEVRTLQARYDKQGQLIGALSGEGSVALAALVSPTTAQIDAIWAQYGISYDYDLAGRRISSTDQNGNRTLFYYGSDGNLTHTINALGEVSESQYNALGQRIQSIAYGTRIASATLATLNGGLVDATLSLAITAITNVALDSKTSYVYDKRGAVVNVTDALGNLNNRIYTLFGELSSSTDKIDTSNTVITNYTYDKRSDLLSTTVDSAGLNLFSGVVRDAFGRVVTMIDANGKISGNAYDRAGRVVQTTDASGIGRSTTYDAFDRVLTQSDGLGNITTTAYNKTAHTITVTTAEGIQTVTTQNRHGQTISVKDGNGTTTYSYDNNGNLKSTTEASGVLNLVSSSTYDKADRVIETVDANGVKTSYGYDAVGRILSRKVDPAGLNLTTTYAYDAKGQQITTTDALGRVVQTTYDLKGQALEVAVDPAGLNLRTQYTYDAQGKILTVIEAAGSSTPKTTQYTYDKAGRRTKEQLDPAGLNLTTSYVYDKNGNLTSKTDARGGVSYYKYDESNRLSRSVDEAGYLTAMTYDAEGHLTQTIRYANVSPTPASLVIPTVSSQDITTNLVYDKDGRQIATIDGEGYVTEMFYDDANQLMRTVRYVNVSPNRASSTAWRPTANIKDRNTWFQYDAAGRQIATIDAEYYVTETVYDKVGQATKTIRYAAASFDPVSPTAWRPTVQPALDKTTTAVYDNAGRLIQTTDAAGYGIKHTYDAAGRETDTVRGSVTTHRVFDAAGRVIEETFAYGTGVAATTRYVLDAQGNQTKIIDPRGVELSEQDTTWAQAQRASLGYPTTVAGLSAAQKQALLALYTTTQQFDALGRKTVVTDALGGSITTKYDANGNAVKVTDQRGNVGYFYFDKLDRLVMHVNPEGSVSKAEYDAFGNRTKETQYATLASGIYNETTVPTITVNAANDSVNTYSYDHLGRLKTEALGYGTVTVLTQYSYNAFGDMTQKINPVGGVFTYVYDGRGLLKQETLPPTVHDTLGTLVAVVNTYTYDARGNRLSMVEAAGLPEQRTTTYTYDKLDRLVSTIGDTVSTYKAGIVAGVAPTQTNTYDARGNVIQTTDANGNRSLTWYDALDRKIAEVDATGALTTRTFDDAGNAISVRTYGDAVVVPAVGSAVPAPVNASNYREVLFKFDANNRQIEARSKNVEQGRYNPTSGMYEFVTTDIVNSGTYDAAGNLIKQTDTYGNSTWFYYDKAGRQIAQVDAGRYLTTMTYRADGKMTQQVRYANALAGSFVLSSSNTVSALVTAAGANAADRTIQYVYDTVGRLTQQTELNVEYYSLNATTGAPAALSASATTSYQYNGLGKVTQKTDANGGVSNWEFDALGRQTRHQGVAFTDFEGSIVRPTERALYDGLGNLIGTSQEGKVDTTALTAEDRITSYEYLAGGRVYRMTDPNGAVTTYFYDANGNQTYSNLNRADADGGPAISVFEEKLYDAANREIWSNAAGALKETKYNVYGEVIAERLNGGNAAGDWQEYAEYNALGKVSKTNTGSGGTKAYFYDANGNATGLAESASVDLRSMTSSQILTAIDANPQNFSWTISAYDARNQLTDTYQSSMIELSRETVTLRPVYSVLQTGAVSVTSTVFNITGQLTSATRAVVALRAKDSVNGAYSLINIPKTSTGTFQYTFSSIAPNSYEYVYGVFDSTGKVLNVQGGDLNVTTTSKSVTPLADPVTTLGGNGRIFFTDDNRLNLTELGVDATNFTVRYSAPGANSWTTLGSYTSATVLGVVTPGWLALDVTALRGDYDLQVDVKNSSGTLLTTLTSTINMLNQASMASPLTTLVGADIKVAVKPSKPADSIPVMNFSGNTLSFTGLGAAAATYTWSWRLVGSTGAWDSVSGDVVGAAVSGDTSGIAGGNYNIQLDTRSATGAVLMSLTTTVAIAAKVAATAGKIATVNFTEANTARTVVLSYRVVGSGATYDLATLTSTNGLFSFDAIVADPSINTNYEYYYDTFDGAAVKLNRMQGNMQLGTTPTVTQTVLYDYASLGVAIKPTKPTDATPAISFTGTTMNISGLGSATTAYTLLWRVAGSGSAWSSTTGTVSGGAATITGVTASDNYEIELDTRNASGSTVMSLRTTVTLATLSTVGSFTYNALSTITINASSATRTLILSIKRSSTSDTWTVATLSSGSGSFSFDGISAPGVGTNYDYAYSAKDSGGTVINTADGVATLGVGAGLVSNHNSLGNVTATAKASGGGTVTYSTSDNLLKFSGLGGGSPTYALYYRISGSTGAWTAWPGGSGTLPSTGAVNINIGNVGTSVYEIEMDLRSSPTSVVSSMRATIASSGASGIKFGSITTTKITGTTAATNLNMSFRKSTSDPWTVLNLTSTTGTFSFDGIADPAASDVYSYVYTTTNGSNTLNSASGNATFSSSPSVSGHTNLLGSVGAVSKAKSITPTASMSGSTVTFNSLGAASSYSLSYKLSSGSIWSTVNGSVVASTLSQNLGAAGTYDIKLDVRDGSGNVLASLATSAMVASGVSSVTSALSYGGITTATFTEISTARSLILSFRRTTDTGTYTVTTLSSTTGVFSMDGLSTPSLNEDYDYLYDVKDGAGALVNKEHGQVRFGPAATVLSHINDFAKIAVSQKNATVPGDVLAKVNFTGTKLYFTGLGAAAATYTLRYRTDGSAATAVWTTKTGTVTTGAMTVDIGVSTGIYDLSLDLIDSSSVLVTTLVATVSPSSSSVTSALTYNGITTATFTEAASAKTLVLSFRRTTDTGTYTVATLSSTTGVFTFDGISAAGANEDYDYLYDVKNSSSVLISKAHGQVRFGPGAAILSHFNDFVQISFTQKNSTTTVGASDGNLHFTGLDANATQFTVRYRETGTSTWTTISGLTTATAGTLDVSYTGLKSGAQYDIQLDSKNSSSVLLSTLSSTISLAGISNATPLTSLYGSRAISNAIHRQQQHNAFGEVSREIDGLGRVTDLSYSHLGKLITKVDPQTNVTLGNGFITRATPTTTYGYDLAGRAIGNADPNGNITTTQLLAWDASDTENVKTAKEFHADGGIVTSGYDIFGDARYNIDEAGRRTDFVYDKKGQLVQVVRPQRAVGTASYLSYRAAESYAYDTAGNRISHTNALGQTEKFYYDNLGRITKARSFFGLNTTYSYNYVNTVLGVGGAAIGGWQKTITNPDGKQLIDEVNYFGKTTRHLDMGGHLFTYSYDLGGRLVKQTADTGQNIDYTYYANGYVKSILDNANGTLTRYGYDAEGNRTFEAYSSSAKDASGLYQTYYQLAEITYDELNRVVKAVDPRAEITYEYDAAGNRKHVYSTYQDLVDGTLRTQDLWYSYDKMNRFIISMGQLNGARATTSTDTTRYVVRGTGVQVSYDFASQRVQAIQNDSSNVAHTENYTYTADGYLENTNIDGVLRSQRVNDAAGRMVKYTEYNTSGAVTLTRTITLDADSRTTQDVSVSGGNTTTTTYDYGVGQKSALQWTNSVTGSSSLRTDYTYTYWDEAKTLKIEATPSATKVKNWQPGYTDVTYDVNGHIKQAVDHVANRTLSYINDAYGQILERDETSGTTVKREVYYYLNGKRVGDMSNDGPSNVSYAETLARSEEKSTAKHGDFRYGKAVSSADFDQSYEPIGPNYPATSPGSYTVHTGDTLASIASALWGDSSLWYLIADANGLKGTDVLVSGERLTIPNKVTNIHNNSGTFKVYDAGEAIGDLQATTPPAPKPKHKKHGCVQLIIQLVVVVVSVIIMQPEIGLMAMVGEGLGAAATSVGVTLSETAMALATDVVTGAIAGAVSSSIGQGLEMAAGLRSKFSFASMGVDTVRNALIGARLQGRIGGAMGLGKDVVSILDYAKSYASAALAAVVVNSGVQATKMALGLQQQFSWQEMASIVITHAAAGMTIGHMAAAIGGKVETAAGLTFSNLLKTTLSGEVRFGLATGAATNALSQGIQMAVGLQKGGFDMDQFTFATASAAAQGAAILGVKSLKNNTLSPQQSRAQGATDNTSAIVGQTPQRTAFANWNDATRASMKQGAAVDEDVRLLASGARTSRMLASNGRSDAPVTLPGITITASRYGDEPSRATYGDRILLTDELVSERRQYADMGTVLKDFMFLSIGGAASLALGAFGVGKMVAANLALPAVGGFTYGVTSKLLTDQVEGKSSGFWDTMKAGAYSAVAAMAIAKTQGAGAGILTGILSPVGVNLSAQTALVTSRALLWGGASVGGQLAFNGGVSWSVVASTMVGGGLMTYAGKTAGAWFPGTSLYLSLPPTTVAIASAAELIEHAGKFSHQLYVDASRALPQGALRQDLKNFAGGAISEGSFGLVNFGNSSTAAYALGGGAFMALGGLGTTTLKGVRSLFPKSLVTKGDQVTEQVIREAMKDAPLVSQQAGGLSLPRVQAYVDRYLEGGIPHSIKVDGRIVVDGNHRYVAGRVVGVDVPIQPYSGGRESRVVPWDKIPVDPNPWQR